jgi:hypothetical protein
MNDFLDKARSSFNLADVEFVKVDLHVLGHSLQGSLSFFGLHRLLFLEVFWNQPSSLVIVVHALLLVGHGGYKLIKIDRITVKQIN